MFLHKIVSAIYFLYLSLVNIIICVLILGTFLVARYLDHNLSKMIIERIGTSCLSFVHQILSLIKQHQSRYMFHVGIAFLGSAPNQETLTGFGAYVESFFMVRVRVRVIMSYDVTSTHVQFVHRCTTSDGLSQQVAPARNISRNLPDTPQHSFIMYDVCSLILTLPIGKDYNFIMTEHHNQTSDTIEEDISPPKPSHRKHVNIRQREDYNPHKLPCQGFITRLPK